MSQRSRNIVYPRRESRLTGSSEISYRADRHSPQDADPLANKGRVGGRLGHRV